MRKLDLFWALVVAACSAAGGGVESESESESESGCAGSELVPGDWSHDFAMAIDGQGDVHLLLVDRETERLVHARGGPSKWTTEDIPMPSGVEATYDSRASGIEIDSAGNIHAIGRLGRHLIHGLRDAAGGWTAEVVTEHADGPALVIDNDGRIGILHGVEDGPGLVYSVRSDDGWVVAAEVVDSTRAGRAAMLFTPPSAAVDADGVVHVAYHIPLDDPDGSPPMRYAWRSTKGEWAVEVLAPSDQPKAGYSTRFESALGLDADGSPHILFMHRNDLYHARRAPNGTWSYEDFGVEGRSVALVVGQTTIGLDMSGRLLAALVTEAEGPYAARYEVAVVPLDRGAAKPTRVILRDCGYIPEIWARFSGTSVAVALRDDTQEPGIRVAR